ncbi:hypothetical protein HYH02_004643 [Chlamydomonas schloesseri]|uniref:BAH domain-containing protein n=1 Tax=Chlamydomonas schloesseri TaxID=2026947 RepID=A0A835WN14_9CHLO|nr:hypothetical protein HYH02_004643 [Chlamydomonas schloesseri]|eukprot:KAG2450808.1 hypothetical protein HYH02_004643 [Chlamydomonas schloesseri]
MSDVSEDEDVEEQPSQRVTVKQRDPDSGLPMVIEVGGHYTAGKPFIVEKYDTIMLHSEEGVPYIGVVMDFSEGEDEARPGETEVQARMCWLYRTRDVKGPAKAAVGEMPVVVRRAALSAAPTSGGGDKGMFQEVLVSNHADVVSAACIMHHIRVWCLPDERLDPLLVPAVAAGSGPPPGAAAAAPTAAVARSALLPGFVARRLYNPEKSKLLPLGKVAPAVAKREFKPWVGEMVSELLRRTQEQLPGAMAGWVRLCAQRQARYS